MADDLFNFTSGNAFMRVTVLQVSAEFVWQQHVLRGTGQGVTTNVRVALFTQQGDDGLFQFGFGEFHGLPRFAV